MKIAESLITSLEEALDIHEGKTTASRVTQFSIADVKAIRAKLNVSQQEFADALGTSIDTIKSWESKRRNPTGLAAKVLATIQDDPSVYKQIATH
jgi:DNA-binding transcriptional regulator YiaG